MGSFETSTRAYLGAFDNNTVQRSIRPIALNRKNALFAGSDGGAGHWATVASLIEACKLNDIDPLRYLTASSPGSSTVIPIATSTSCCPGPIESRSSRPWPKNSAYNQAKY